MIRTEKQDIANRTIHDLLIHGRILAYKKKDTDFAHYFDELEYLMGLILDRTNDRTEQFEVALKATCNHYDCEHVFVKYEKDIFY